MMPGGFFRFLRRLNPNILCRNEAVLPDSHRQTATCIVAVRQTAPALVEDETWNTEHISAHIDYTTPKNLTRKNSVFR